ncbi:MAG: hypothetical protein F7B18_05005 [Desulfurococcales archaeon]|nr:hypothetical protein [Desulfurococcales archaeon]
MGWTGIRILGPGDVDSLMDPLLMVEEIRRVLMDEEAVEAPRTSLEHGGSWFGVMPAAGRGFYSLKLVGVYPGNPGRGLPLVRGRLLLVNAQSGEVLLDADAGPATGWRTAAATALALELLGGTRGVLGMIGAGVQARYHLEVLTRLYDYTRVLVYSRSRGRAEDLARRYNGSAASLEEVLRASDVIVAATTATEPVVRGSMLGEDVVVASVGAPKPVRELDGETLSRASCILIDTPMVLEESGDVTPKTAPRRKIAELRGLLRGREKCPGSGVRVYKSVGRPLFDLAAAILLHDRLEHVP